MTTLILSQLDIQSIITHVGVDELMDQLISKLDDAFRDFDPQHTKIPVRDGFNYSTPRQGLLEWMPMLETGEHVLMKIVGYHPRNPDLSQLPTILSDFSLYNAQTGQLEAIVDGTLLTAMRTGAASAVASRLLAKPESRIVGFIGCGAQAVTQLHGLSRVFDFDCVRFFDTNASAMASFERRCQHLVEGVTFEASNLDEVLSKSDIISVATTVDIGAGPVFKDQATQDHLHINAVGSDFPNKFELPLGLLKRSFITPDVRAQADAEGECQQLEASDIGDEFYDLMRLSNRHADLQKRTTVFDSTGWVLEDYVVTKLFLEIAQQIGVGSKVVMGTQSGDPKDPYKFLALQSELAKIKVESCDDVALHGEPA